jgi:uncharacterized SAM-binding protein YcdF (DUF218 family)
MGWLCDVIMGETIWAIVTSQTPSEIARPRGAGYRLRLYLLCMLVLVALGAGAWFGRTTLLQEMADLWVVSDPITRADAVVVLGGGYDVRPVVAADLYAKGFVHKVLVSQDGRAKIGTLTGDTELNVKILRKLGVPDRAIEFFGKGSKNTWDEAIALKNWTKQHPTSALIIPAEVFFARRAQWIFRREFSGTHIRIEVPSYDPPHAYSRAGWWKTGGWSTFPSEVLKYAYYRLMY